MIVTIDPSAGFCWGVVRTIEIAETELIAGESLASLGDIIHNPQEIDRLHRLGLSTINEDSLASVPKGTKVLIRAHGEPPETYRLAHQMGIELIDATCPVVTKLQERIKRYYDDGYQIVIFGKKDHAEVIGLRGVCRDQCIVLKTLNEAEEAIDMQRKTVLFSQTTMDKGTFNEITEFLQKKIKDIIIESGETNALEFHSKDTICGQVSGREGKLKEYCLENDVIIFIAGKKSSNGKVLFDICKSVNKSTYFVEVCEEIDPNWFESKSKVGITGATSTPHWLMNKAKERVEGFAYSYSKPGNIGL
jgi:4-hydroxy-3-methylbut-2-en-1-yl diphosphate reductase